MIELKVTVEDEGKVSELLSELNSRDGVFAQADPKPYEMDDEDHSMSVSETTTAWGSVGIRKEMNDAALLYFSHPDDEEPLRVVPHEELSRCITLESFREEMTDMIHKHYHPQE